jgi:hypothetical protein
MATTPRITDSEVREIFPTALTSLSAFITAAHMMVDRVFLNQNVDESVLKELERWLSAHFICIAEPEITRDKIGDAETWYAIPSNITDNSMYLGFQATSYGRQAMILDPTGLLTDIGKNAVSIGAMGTRSH